MFLLESLLSFWGMRSCWHHLPFLNLFFFEEFTMWFANIYWKQSSINWSLCTLKTNQLWIMVELFYQWKSIIIQHSKHEKLSVGGEINSQRIVCLWCKWKKGIDHLRFQQVRAWKKYSNYICKITRGGRCGENKNSVVPSLGDFVAFGPAMSVRTQPGSHCRITKNIF